jgi:hypothetical protein
MVLLFLSRDEVHLHPNLLTQYHVDGDVHCELDEEVALAEDENDSHCVHSELRQDIYKFYLVQCRFDELIWPHMCSPGIVGSPSLFSCYQDE